MSAIRVTDTWTVKERINGLWVPVAHTHNLLTTFGLNTYAIAVGGNWVPPQYFVIDIGASYLQDNYPASTTIIQTDTNPTVGGDTTLTIGAGLSNQEDVTFSSMTGTGPFTFTLSGSLQNDHVLFEPAVRTPTVSDTIASVLVEAQYDPILAPNQRNQVTSSYTADTGFGVIQFFFSASQVSGLFVAHVGMADSPTIGQGNLHNYAVLGYNRTTTNDLEIDINYHLTNA